MVRGAGRGAEKSRLVPLPPPPTSPRRPVCVSEEECVGVIVVRSRHRVLHGREAGHASSRGSGGSSAPSPPIIEHTFESPSGARGSGGSGAPFAAKTWTTGLPSCERRGGQDEEEKGGQQAGRAPQQQPQQ